MSEQRRDWACWALQHTDALPGLPSSQWEQVVRHARRADVLARIAAQLQARGLVNSVPAAPRAHLVAALRVWKAQREEVQLEAALISGVLQRSGVPVVLLKGAGYVMAESPAAQGRLFSDTDILVPRALLDQAESALRLAGWMGDLKSGYDQRYYREWMHELPPMTHVRRGTTLDVHHNILPITVRQPPDAALLLADAQVVPKHPGLLVLSVMDRILHSMTHLFHNDELSHGLRDLSDLDLMLREASGQPEFWSEVILRAQALHVERPLAYGLWACHEIMGTPVPDAAREQADKAARLGWQRGHMRWLWRRVLRTPHGDCALPGTGLASFALYVRAHWLRMPPRLLARHLTIKAFRRLTARAAAEPGQRLA
jgi:hypothetical protein